MRAYGDSELLATVPKARELVLSPTAETTEEGRALEVKRVAPAACWEQPIRKIVIKGDRLCSCGDQCGHPPLRVRACGDL
jgi:hypothetical protein